MRRSTRLAVSLVAVASLVGGGCSGDPTRSSEYQEIATELDAAQAVNESLGADVAERDLTISELRVAVDELTAEIEAAESDLEALRDGLASEAESLQDEIDDLTLTPVDWEIEGPSKRLMIHMIAELGPFTSEPAEGLAVSGVLLWDDAALKLCNLYVRDVGYEVANDGSGHEFLEVGDIFETWETDGVCGSAALEVAIDEHGSPHEGCVYVAFDGDGQLVSYCGRFTPDG